MGKNNMNNGSKDGKYKKLFLAMTVVLICMVCVLGLYVTGITQPAGSQTESSKTHTAGEEPAEAADIPGSLSHEGYELEQVVILSRHNIRSPLSSKGSVLETITPHEWYEWSSPASELSVRGGTLETCMGQYFRKWLEEEGLFPENYHPDEEAVRIYANSKQRTIATAQFFTAGLMPTVNEPVEYHVEFDTMDPVFNPQLTFTSDKYNEAAIKQIDEMYSDDIEDLEDNYELLSDVVDMEESEAYQDGTIKDFDTDDTRIILETGREPSSEGSLRTACSVSDAMVLQYYEESDPVKAGFGNDLTEEQWEDISEIKDLYVDVLFSAPLIAANVANPLLKELQSEMSEEDRQLTFLCGHDSNLTSVLAALRTEEYELPDSIEKKTPIGSKIVFSRWSSEDGKMYCSVDLVYQTTEQLRELELLDSTNHPAIFPITLEGLEKNADGLYEYEDVEKRIADAIGEYDRIRTSLY